MKTLRPYQDAAIKSLWNWLFTEGTGHPLVVAPVGAGKSLIIAEFIKQCHEKYPRTRILVMAHVKELLVQNAQELMAQYPECDFGFYCAGLNEKKLHNDVTFASIQSLHGNLDKINRPAEIILIDEAHLIPHKSITRYRAFIDQAIGYNPSVKVIGLTGTPFRADSGRLEEGEGALFDGVAYEIGMDYMIEEGYWVKPMSPGTAFKMDVSGVETRNGDYIESQLQQKINTDEVNDACVEELVEKGKDRKRWLVFTAGIQHAEEVTKKLQSAGISAVCVTSENTKEENDAALQSHKSGRVTALVNVAKLTTGYNDPDIDLLCFMRPTRSPVLYIQCMGRGIRTSYADGYGLLTREGRLQAIAASHKPDCMVLDFGGIIEALGPIDQVCIKSGVGAKEKDDKEEKNKPATKICPNCSELCMAAQRYCYVCSYSFLSLADKAAEKAIISSEEEPEWVEVIGMAKTKHFKKESPDAPPTMKVIYTTLRGQFYDFVCVEHHKFKGDKKYYAYEKALAWFNIMLHPIYESARPATVDEALELTYLQPSRIMVKRNGKFWNVINYDFSRPEKEHEEEYFEIPF